MTAAEAALSLRRKLVAAHHAKGSALTEAEWLAVAEKELSTVLRPAKRAPRASISSGIGLSDESWLAELGSHPALAGVNIRAEVERCRLWSGANNVKPSRKRIVNWLLRATLDKPLRVDQGRFAASQQNNSNSLGPDEPMGWREEFSDSMWAATPWPEVSASSRLFIVQKMAELGQRQA